MTGPAGASGDALLSIDDAVLSMDDGQRRTIIQLAGCELRAGHCYALVGPSGIGKTTALEMLALVRKPDRVRGGWLRTATGDVDLEPLLTGGRGNVLDGLRAANFGYVVQSNPLLPFLTVRQNVSLSQQIAGRPDDQLADALLETMQLASLGEVYPSNLSGGQRQRVCVARALAHRPSVVLADEPTSAVDAEIGKHIIGVLRSYANECDAAVLVVTHNTALANAFNLEMMSISSTVDDGTMRTVIGTSVHVPCLTSERAV